MARWLDFVEYVQARYDVADSITDKQGNPRFLKLGFNLDGGRSQVTYLDFADDERSEGWVEISSPFASADGADFAAVLEDLANAPCGALAMHSGLLFLKHDLALDGLQSEVFERALEAVTTSADILERHWGDGDAL